MPMTGLESAAEIIIPANKFYAPHIDPSQSLLRTDLLHNKFPRDITAKKVILIEAQAGQGKTTLACQFLDHFRHDSLWYQIGPEDSDPVFLLTALLFNLKNKFPDFSSPQLEDILNRGTVGPLDINRCADILLKGLDGYLDHDVFITFDDLHLLPAETITASLLEYLLDTSPPKLHFILISRHPVSIKSKTLRNGIGISYLNTEDLALNSLEIEDLFNKTLGKPINRKEAKEIERITGGWIMGIVLAGHPVSGREKFWQEKTLPQAPSGKHGHMLEYFRDEIFTRIPKYLHVPFLQLSFLNEIPIDLAVRLTGFQNMETLLTDMARGNFFVYQLDDNQSIFRFHHLFQEFLQLQAVPILSAAEINAILSMEAEYYLQKNRLEKALACYKNAGDFQTMNTILQQHGMLLIEKNRTLSLLSLLQTIPQDVLFRYNWLTLYAGLLRVDFNPESATPFFDAARTRFIDAGDETGELIALSQIIYFHFGISGRYALGAGLLERTEELFKKNETNLPIHVRIMAARNLASGFGFFISDLDKAREYATLANDLSITHDIRTFIASSRFIVGYIDLLSGDFSHFLQEAENCFTLINDPLVSVSNKMTFRIMYLCYLSMMGDLQNYLDQQEELLRSIDQTIITQTITAPYLFVWECSCLISEGKIEKASEVLNRGLDISQTARTEHMHSQLLQWQAYIHALLGEREAAHAALEESIRLRNIAGGPFYQAFQNILAGAVYTRTNEFDLAAKALKKGLEQARSVPSPYLQACALTHSSYLNLVCSDTQAAARDLKDGLLLMKENHYVHLWGWEPVMLAGLLNLAMAAGIEKIFVSDLAEQRLHQTFSEDQTMIPKLQISLLDTFSITCGGDIICGIDDFTLSQRELLGLMLMAKGQKINQEKAQLHFWPDSPPEKARKKFDTLLGRLRKFVQDHLDVPVQNFIALNKGYLCLNHADSDFLLFMDVAQKALAHSKRNEWWQASHCFNRALASWQGNLPTDSFTNDAAVTWDTILLEKLTRISMTWARYLAKIGRTDEAIRVMERLLLSSALEEEAILLLCSFYQQNNMPLKVKKTLERYKRALTDIDYSEDEIEEIMADITIDTKL